MTAAVTDRRAGAGVNLRRLGRRHLLVAALLPVILLGLLGAMLLLRPGSSPTAIGRMAPDFELTDLDGAPIRLAELRGRPVIVNFWASGACPAPTSSPSCASARAARRRRAGRGGDRLPGPLAGGPRVHGAQRRGRGQRRPIRTGAWPRRMASSARPRRSSSAEMGALPPGRSANSRMAGLTRRSPPSWRSEHEHGTEPPRHSPRAR